MLFLREYPRFQMQGTNATLFTWVIVKLVPPFCSDLKYKLDIISWVYAMLKRIPPFPNARYKCDIIYWCYFMLEKISPSFKIQRQNLTLFTRSINCSGKDLL